MGWVLVMVCRCFGVSLLKLKPGACDSWGSDPGGTVGSNCDLTLAFLWHISLRIVLGSTTRGKLSLRIVLKLTRSPLVYFGSRLSRNTPCAASFFPFLSSISWFVSDFLNYPAQSHWRSIAFKDIQKAQYAFTTSSIQGIDNYAKSRFNAIA